jgi:hypothetical protein
VQVQVRGQPEELHMHHHACLAVEVAYMGSSLWARAIMTVIQQNFNTKSAAAFTRLRCNAILSAYSFINAVLSSFRVINALVLWCDELLLCADVVRQQLAVCDTYSAIGSWQPVSRPKIPQHAAGGIMVQTLHADPRAAAFVEGCMQHLLAVKELEIAEQQQQQQQQQQEASSAAAVLLPDLEVSTLAVFCVCMRMMAMTFAYQSRLHVRMSGLNVTVKADSSNSSYSDTFVPLLGRLSSRLSVRLLPLQAFILKKLCSQPGMRSISFDEPGVLWAYVMTHSFAGIQLRTSLQNMQLQCSFTRGVRW